VAPGPARRRGREPLGSASVPLTWGVTWGGSRDQRQPQGLGSGGIWGLGGGFWLGFGWVLAAGTGSPDTPPGQGHMAWGSLPPGKVDQGQSIPQPQGCTAPRCPQGPSRGERGAQPSLPAPAPLPFPFGCWHLHAQPGPCPALGCQREQGRAELAGDRGQGAWGEASPPLPPAHCGWSRGVEVTRGDTAAQKATTRTTAGSAEDAGGHAPPNARWGHPGDTPRGQPARGIPRQRHPAGLGLADEGTELTRQAWRFRGWHGDGAGRRAGVTAEVAPAEPGAVPPPALTGRK